MSLLLCWAFKFDKFLTYQKLFYFFLQKSVDKSNRLWYHKDNERDERVPQKKEEIKMFGIYKYENGLKFTGKIAATKEAAENFLGQLYGHMEDKFMGWGDNGEMRYEQVFVPYYNKRAFEIIELETVEG